MGLGQEVLSHGERSDLRAALFREWQGMNDMLVHDEQPALLDNRQHLPSRCNQMGMCICEPPGVKAWLFHGRLTSCLKPFFTPKRQRRQRDSNGRMVAVELPAAEKPKQAKLKLNRQLLQDGFIVVRLDVSESKPEARAEGDSAESQGFVHRSWRKLSDRSLSSGADDDSESSPHTVWFHLGHVNYSTWALGLLKLYQLGGPDEQGYLKLDCGSPCEASHSLRMLVASKVDMDLRWKSTVYTIVSNGDLLEREAMCPDWVLVKEFLDVPSALFWQGWNVEESRYKASLRNSRQSQPSTRKRKKTASGSVVAAVDAASGPVETLPEEPVAQHLLEDADDGSSAGESVPRSEIVEELEHASPREPDESELTGAVPSAASHAASADAENAAGPVLAEPRVVGVRREGRPTTVVPFARYGDLRFNAEASHIVAVCSNPKHGALGDCRRIRTVNAAAGRTVSFNPNQGRPIGLLSAWLKASLSYDTAEEHKSSMALRMISREDRIQARAEFMQEANAAFIAESERERFEGEPEEPDVIR